MGNRPSSTGGGGADSDSYDDTSSAPASPSAYAASTPPGAGAAAGARRREAQRLSNERTDSTATMMRRRQEEEDDDDNDDDFEDDSPRSRGRRKPTTTTLALGPPSSREAKPKPKVNNSTSKQQQTTGGGGGGSIVWRKRRRREDYGSAAMEHVLSTSSGTDDDSLSSYNDDGSASSPRYPSAVDQLSGRRSSRTARGGGSVSDSTTTTLVSSSPPRGPSGGLAAVASPLRDSAVATGVASAGLPLNNATLAAKDASSLAIDDRYLKQTLGLFFDARAHSIVQVRRSCVRILDLAKISAQSSGNRVSGMGAGVARASGAVNFSEAAMLEAPVERAKIRLPSTCTACAFVDGSDGFLAHDTVLQDVSPKRRKDMEEALPWVICACVGAFNGSPQENPVVGGAQTSENNPSSSDAASAAADHDLSSPLWSETGATVASLDFESEVRKGAVFVLRARDGALLHMIRTDLSVPEIASPSSLEDQRDIPSFGTEEFQQDRPGENRHRHRGEVSTVVWTPDARLLVGMTRGYLLSFSLFADALTLEAKLPQRPTCVAYDSAIRCAVVGFATSLLRVYRLPTPRRTNTLNFETRSIQHVATLDGHGAKIIAAIAAVAVPGNGRGLQSSSSGIRLFVTGSEDGTVRLWPLPPNDIGKLPIVIREVCGYKFKVTSLFYDRHRNALFVGDHDGLFSVCQVKFIQDTSSKREFEIQVLNRHNAGNSSLSIMSFCSFTDTLVTGCSSPGDINVGVWPETTGLSHGAVIARVATEIAPPVPPTTSTARTETRAENRKERITFLDAERFENVISLREELVRLLPVLLPFDAPIVDPDDELVRRRVMLQRGFARTVANLQLALDLATYAGKARATMLYNDPEGPKLELVLRRQLQELRGLLGPSANPEHLREAPRSGSVSASKEVARHRATCRNMLRKALLQYSRFRDICLPVIRVSAKSGLPDRLYRLGALFEKSEGATHRAVAVQTETEVAVKILPQGVDLTLDLDHEGIARVLDVAEGPEPPSIQTAARAFLELCQKRMVDADASDDESQVRQKSAVVTYVVLPMLADDLGSVVQNSTSPHLPNGFIARTMFGLLRAISYLHSRRMVVRDLRPQRILLSHDGLPVIIHLGVMRAVLGTTESEPPEQGWSFAAPELFSRAVRGASDVWSLGVLLAYLLADRTDRQHRPLFHGDSALDVVNSQIEFAGPPSPLALARMAEECCIGETDVVINYVRTGRWTDRSPEARMSLFRAALPKAPGLALDLLSKMLRFATQERENAVDLLTHPWFESFGLIPSLHDRELRPLTDLSATTEFDATEHPSTAIWSARTMVSPGGTVARLLSSGATSDDASDSSFDEDDSVNSSQVGASPGASAALANNNTSPIQNSSHHHHLHASTSALSTSTGSTTAAPFAHALVRSENTGLVYPRAKKAASSTRSPPLSPRSSSSSAVRTLRFSPEFVGDAGELPPAST